MKPTIYSLIILLMLFALTWAQPIAAQDKSADQPTLAQACTANPALADILQKSGMMPLLSNKGPYTFFVPSDKALQHLSQLDPTIVREILMGHLLEGRLTAADFRDGAVLTSASKQTIRVCRKKEKLMLNGILVSSSDKILANGVMHTVDGLLAKSQLQASLL